MNKATSSRQNRWKKVILSKVLIRTKSERGQNKGEGKPFGSKTAPLNRLIRAYPRLTSAVRNILYYEPTLKKQHLVADSEYLATTGNPSSIYFQLIK